MKPDRVTPPRLSLTTLLAAAVGLGGLGAAACAERVDEADADSPQIASRSATERRDEPFEEERVAEGDRAGTDRQVGAETAPGAGAAGELSDAEVAAVVFTVNSAEVSAGELALRKATNPAVKGYAQRMVDEHTALTQAARGDAEQEDLDPTRSPLSSQLKAEADSTMQTLQAKSGPEFDRAYIESQVAMHRRVLGTFDQVLLESARDPQLQGTLEDARSTIEDHLREAQEVQSELEPA